MNHNSSKWFTDMFVHAAANPAMPGLIKIGKASNVEERLADLSRSTVMPFPFRLVASAPAANNSLAEALLHGTFAAFRVAHNREFFRVDEAAVICAFKLLELTARIAPIDAEPAPNGNVVPIRSGSGGAEVLDALRTAGRPLSNRELAKLMGVCDGEASKRRQEVAKLIVERRVGREMMVSLIGETTCGASQGGFGTPLPGPISRLARSAGSSSCSGFTRA